MNHVVKAKMLRESDEPIHYNCAQSLFVAFSDVLGVRDERAFAMGANYGGGFSCMPAYLSDLFGTKQLSAIHGRILSAWAMAGIAGPTLISFFYKQTGTYASVLIFFAVLFIPNLIIAIQLKGKGFEQKEVPALDSLETK